MEEKVNQLLIDVIRKIFKIKEETGVAVDIHISISFLIVDFYFYADKNDTEYTHSESVHLDSSDAEEELDNVYELLRSMGSATKQTSIINNNLN